MGTRLLWACLCLALLTHGASAQSTAGQSVLGYLDTNGRYVPYDTTGAGLPVQATFSGSVTTAATASSTLPSLAAGTRAIYENLSGGLYVQQTQAGAIVSATNGGYTNLLQGNAVISSGNPIFAQLTAGSAAIGAVTTGSASTDGSTTITAGGTAQNLFSGATPAHGFEVCNPGTTDDLWVSDSTTAAANNTGSFRVALNGGCYVTPAGRLPIGAVSIVGATTGDNITARSW